MCIYNSIVSRCILKPVINCAEKQRIEYASITKDFCIKLF